MKKFQHLLKANLLQSAPKFLESLNASLDSNAVLAELESRAVENEAESRRLERQLYGGVPAAIIHAPYAKERRRGTLKIKQHDLERLDLPPNAAPGASDDGKSWDGGSPRSTSELAGIYQRDSDNDEPSYRVREESLYDRAAGEDFSDDDEVPRGGVKRRYSLDDMDLDGQRIHGTSSDAFHISDFSEDSLSDGPGGAGNMRKKKSLDYSPVQRMESLHDAIASASPPAQVLSPVPSYKDAPTPTPQDSQESQSSQVVPHASSFTPLPPSSPADGNFMWTDAPGDVLPAIPKQPLKVIPDPGNAGNAGNAGSADEERPDEEKVEVIAKAETFPGPAPSKKPRKLPFRPVMMGTKRRVSNNLAFPSTKEMYSIRVDGSVMITDPRKKKQYSMYIISMESKQGTFWQVYRRYSEIRKLHMRFEKMVTNPSKDLPELTRRRLFSTAERIVKHREKRLNEYFTELHDTADAYLQVRITIEQFLDVFNLDRFLAENDVLMVNYLQLVGHRSLSVSELDTIERFFGAQADMTKRQSKSKQSVSVRSNSSSLSASAGLGTRSPLLPLPTMAENPDEEIESMDLGKVQSGGTSASTSGDSSAHDDGSLMMAPHDL